MATLYLNCFDKSRRKHWGLMMNKDDLLDLLQLILREFDRSGQWPTLDVLVEDEWHIGIVTHELGSLLEQAEEALEGGDCE